MIDKEELAKVSEEDLRILLTVELRNYACFAHDVADSKLDEPDEGAEDAYFEQWLRPLIEESARFGVPSPVLDGQTPRKEFLDWLKKP